MLHKSYDASRVYKLRRGNSSKIYTLPKLGDVYRSYKTISFKNPVILAYVQYTCSQTFYRLHFLN